MLKKLKPKSEFSRNVLTLMTGSTIAQAIPIAISPILTRIYTPEDFGVFALYISITSILSVIVTGQYELAIMLPKKDHDAINILILSLILSSCISFFLLCIIFLFNPEITRLLGNKEISNWLYLMPISIFLTGIYNSLNYWQTRKKNYKLLAITNVYKGLTVSTSNIAFGIFKYGSSGFILGSFFGQLVGVYHLLKKINIKLVYKQINKLKIIALSKRYRKFPKITVPHALFNSISTNLPILVITYYFSSKETGYFSFASKIVMLPISLISNAYYQVFFESFSKEKNKEFFFKQKFKQVNTIFIPIFLILWFILPDLFSFIFGEEWKISGVYTQILLPLFYLKFISNLFTTTTYIYYEKQFENFFLGILITIIIFFSLLIGAYFHDIVLGLLLMSFGNGVIIIYKIYRSFVFVKNQG